MSDSPPDTLTAAQMKQLLPELGPKVELAVVGGRTYKREGGQWWPLSTCNCGTEGGP